MATLVGLVALFFTVYLSLLFFVVAKGALEDIAWDPAGLIAPIVLSVPLALSGCTAWYFL
jgi:hypothetical protein